MWNLKYDANGTLLVIQWLRLCTVSAGGSGLIPGQGVGSHALQVKHLHAATQTQSSQVNNNQMSLFTNQKQTH